MDVRKSVKINRIGAQGPGGCSLWCLVAPRGLTAAAYGRLGAWQGQLSGWSAAAGQDRWQDPLAAGRKAQLPNSL